MSGIFVGVDGSDHSCHALRWAVREAALHNALLTVVTVCPVPVQPATRIYWPSLNLPENPDDLEYARKAVQELVDEAVSGLGEPMPGAVVIAVRGNPAQELIRQARDANLLVVGCRGSGGFSRLLLGSVTTAVVHHAKCAVVTIPTDRRG